MLVSLVAACYNAAEEITRVLRALDEQEVEYPYEFIVVDNMSDDNTYDVVCSYRPRHYQLRAFRVSRRGGPGAARNVALRELRGELVIFIGDDTVPTPSFIRAHVELHRRFNDPRVAILGRVDWPNDIPKNSLMLHITGVGAQQFSYYYLRSGQEYDYRHFYTSNVSVHSSLLAKEPSGFDESIFFFEDAEFAYRLARHGLRIFYFADPLVFHYHYHSLWSFWVRTFRAGQTVWQVVRKHPRTASLILRPKHWFRKLLHGLSLLYIERRQIDPHLERRALLLASSYEWAQTDSSEFGAYLDFLYIHMLEYAFAKGFVDNVPVPAYLKRLFHKALQLSVLEPAIKKFSQLLEAAQCTVIDTLS